MANVEGGFLGFLKNLFFRKAEQEVAKQTQKKEEPKKNKEEKREARTRAEEIFYEFQRVTPTHPAYEVLKGVEITKEMFITDPVLGEIILNIVHSVNANPTQYHDPTWLKNKISQLGQRIELRRLMDHERERVRKIQENISAMYKKTQKERKQNDVDQEIEKRKLGEESPQVPNIPINEEKAYQHLSNWEAEIDSLSSEPIDPRDPNSSIKQRFEAAKDKINRTGITPEEKQKEYESLYREYIDMKKDAIKKIKDNNPKAVEDYLKLQKVMEAAARKFTEEFPLEDKQIREAERHRGFEFNEQRMQTDADYRDYYFYHIIENVLYNQKTETHRELYGLYEMGDMHRFFEIVRRIPEKDADGKSIGIKLATRYDILKNTLFQAHDFDYYCAHPQQDIKEFIGSTSLFKNEYYDAAVQDPMVALAKRLYEEALMAIRDTHGGYIPREYLLYTEGKMRASKLDEIVERNLKQAIAAGQFFDVRIDPVTGAPQPSYWGRKQMDFDPDHPKPYTLKKLYGGEPEQSDSWRRNLGELRIQAALKQALGLSLVDNRMLEIIGKSRGTGTKYEMYGKEWNASAFNSVPYEGIVRYMDPVIHYYGRFGVGMDIYNAFFNMMVSDSSKYNWDPKHMAKLIPLYLDGEFDKAKAYAETNHLGDISTRLSAVDNPFGYSGFWGTMTKWRVADSSLGFDDYEKDQTYAAAVKLTNIGDVFSAPERESSFQKWGSTWAYKKAKRYFIEVKNKAEYEACRTEYRNKLLESDEFRYKEMAQRDIKKRNANLDEFDSEFEFYWRTTGEGRYGERLNKSWKAQLDGHKRPIKDSELDIITKQLERAYKARVWVQTVNRAPLIIARQLRVQHAAHGDIEDVPLRNKIIWKLLGIDMKTLELGENNLTPTANQEADFDRIVDVEGALGAIQQVSIRENREIEVGDFEKAKQNLADDHQKKQNFELAKEYWLIVQKAMLGGKEASEYYNALGIKNADKTLPRDSRFHKIDWEQIKKIDVSKEKGARGKKDKFILGDDYRTELLNNELIDRNWRHLFSTEDMGWEFLNINALGSRNPVRRAGDLGSHVAFGQLFEQYLVDFVQRPVGKVDDMVEHLHKMFAAMSGDFQDVAAEACARVAYSTGMIYKESDWTWKTPLGLGQVASLVFDTSISQKLHGRDRGVAWGPNEMLHWVQGVGSHILPKARFSKLSGEETMPNSDWDRAKLGKYLNATKGNAAYEILNMTVMIATLIMIYQALTKKSEEEE